MTGEHVRLEEALGALKALEGVRDPVVEEALVEAYRLSHTDNKKRLKGCIDIVLEYVICKQRGLSRYNDNLKPLYEKSIRFTRKAAEKFEDAMGLLGNNKTLSRQLALDFAEKYRTVGYYEGLAAAYDFTDQLKGINEELQALQVVNCSLKYLLDCAENLLICDKDGNVKVDKQGNFVSYKTPKIEVTIDNDGKLTIVKGV